MKSAVLSLVFLTLNVACYGQVECPIFKQVIDEYVLKLRPPNIDYSSKTTLTVLESPAYHNTPRIEDYAKFQVKYENLSRETFMDFVNKSQDAVSFEKINIPNIEFVVLKADSIPKHEELASRYPHWTYSILEFSNVGVNNEKNQALVYYSFNSGAGVGGGVYLVYERKRKKWKQKAVIPAWAA